MLVIIFSFCCKLLKDLVEFHSRVRSAEALIKRSDLPKVFQIVASPYWRLKQGRGRPLQAEATFPKLPSTWSDISSSRFTPKCRFNLPQRPKCRFNLVNTFLSIKEGFSQLKRPFHQEKHPEATLSCKSLHTFKRVASGQSCTNQSRFKRYDDQPHFRKHFHESLHPEATFPQVASSYTSRFSPETTLHVASQLLSCCNTFNVVFIL